MKPSILTDNTPRTAVELDSKLKLHVKNYLTIKGNSTRTLPEDISSHISHLYLALTTDEKAIVDPEELEVDVKKNTPSRTLLMDYYRHGKPMCTRYINALAVFFNQEYSVCQYNPALDLVERFKANRQ